MSTGGQIPYNHIKENSRIIAAVASGDVQLRVDDLWGMSDEDGDAGLYARQIIDACLQYHVNARPNSAELVTMVQQVLSSWQSSQPEIYERWTHGWDDFHNQHAAQWEAHNKARSQVGSPPAGQIKTVVPVSKLTDVVDSGLHHTQHLHPTPMLSVMETDSDTVDGSMTLPL